MFQICDRPLTLSASEVSVPKLHLLKPHLPKLHLLICPSQYSTVYAQVGDEMYFLPLFLFVFVFLFNYCRPVWHMLYCPIG